MKKKIILLLLVFVSTISFAQTDKEAISKTFQEYKQALDNLQLEKSMDYIYPKMYELMPKKKIISLAMKIFSDPNVQIKFSDIELKSISNTTKFKGIKYALVSYKYTMHFTFNKTYSLEQIFSLYQEKYGIKNVSNDIKNRTINIKMSKLFYAINDPKYGNFWRFLEKNTSQMQMLTALIPKEIINKL